MILKIIVAYYIIINIAAFLLYFIDKEKAKAHLWRIHEKTLILFSFLGGGVGALLGMKLFHHKTRKLKFRILVPLGLLLHIALIGFVLYKCGIFEKLINFVK